MSSMLKKPGLGGFKPKAAVARRRPAAGSSSHGPDRSATAERQSKTPAPGAITSIAQEPAPSATLKAIPEQPTPADSSPRSETQVSEQSQHSELPSEEAVVEPTQTKPLDSDKRVAEGEKDNAEHSGVSSAPPANVPIDPLLQPSTRAASGSKPKTTFKPKAPPRRTLPTPTTKDHVESNRRAVEANAAISLEATSTGDAAARDKTPLPNEPIPESVESVYPDLEAGSSAPQAAIQVPTPAASVDGTQISADTALPSVESASQPTAAAPKKPRKRKAPQAEGEEEPRPKKPRKPRARKAATETGEGAGEGENGEAAPKPKKARKKKAAAGNTAEGAEAEPKKARRKRSVTPEDAEERTVDPSQMTMGDLTKDLRIGKKFSRHDELRKRISDKRSRARLIKLGRLPADGQSPNGSNAGTPAPGANEGDLATPGPSDRKLSQSGGVGADGVQYRMVDGQIVVDTRSLVVDRQARAAAENRNLEEIEENDFTRPTTSATYMKPHKVGPNHWTDEETEQFYEFLRKIGTDFNIIAAMFGGKKTRREVKLKFNREERYCPRRINACIVGKKEWQMDMEEIKSHTGKEYEDSKAIEEELARLAAEHEAEEKRAEEEIAEAARQKREALFGNKNGHRAAVDESAGKDEAVTEAEAGDEEAGVDIQDMAQNQTYAGKGKPKGRGRGKRGYGKASQPIASGFGV